jgi:protein SCO1/2
VTFLYTSCEDTCPVQAAQIRGALDELGRDVPVVAISVDPAGDDPAAARGFVTDQRMVNRMRFLTGDADDLQRQWRAYGVAPQEVGSEHSASVVLLDGRGRQRIGFPLDQLTPSRLAHDIARLQRAGEAPAAPQPAGV